jgi:tRNA A-37 threonylcarbamoyl transferase component Bud32
MVVMEYLDKEYFEDIPEWPQDPGLLQKVKWAVRQLHDGGFVHGDMRTVNMKVQKQPKDEMEGVFLPDFDWAGPDGDPRNVNKQVWRSPSVEDGALITKEHDEVMVN